MRHLAVLTIMIPSYGGGNDGSEDGTMCESDYVERQRKKMIHRIHRIQGQMAALERNITDDAPCDELVIEARAVERAVASLTNFMICCHLVQESPDSMRDEAAFQHIQRLLNMTRR